MIQVKGEALQRDEKIHQMADELHLKTSMKTCWEKISSLNTYFGHFVPWHWEFAISARCDQPNTLLANRATRLVTATRGHTPPSAFV